MSAEVIEPAAASGALSTFLERVRFRRSIYWRISTAFAGILLITCALIVFYLLGAWRVLLDRYTQQVSWELAGNIAELIQPSVFEHENPEAIERELYRLSILNPGVELFILDTAGKVRYHGQVRDWQRNNFHTVPIKPLLEALEAKNPQLPIYSTTPLENTQATTFSVAPVILAGERLLLFVPLQSRLAFLGMRSIGERWILQVIFIGLLMIVCTAAVLAILLFRFLTRSFRELTESAERFASGEFTHRVPNSAFEEVGRLASAMNIMAETIVTAQQQRKELIANITHDLRSPLTSMSGFVETLLTEELTEDQRREYLEIVQSDIRSQAALISDLFDLSRLDAQTRPVEPDFFAFDELVEELAIRAVRLGQERNLEVQVSIAESLPPVWGAIELVERVVNNLLQNALRYTAVGGLITISLTNTTGGVKFAIADTGVGIAPDELPKIFDSFYTVDKARAKKNGGTGLGLAIVKRILELHDVEIEVTSEVGKGSTFSFILSTQAPYTVHLEAADR